MSEIKILENFGQLGIGIDFNTHDAQACAEFAPDIYRHLHISQKKYIVPENYLTTYQSDITSNHISILFDWLVEVAEEYHLNNETLYLTKHYIERFLAKIKVPRQKIQLVGVSCMLIASKFEEMFPPGVTDFVYISDNTFTKTQVIEMESLILNSLDFVLANPTMLCFLTRYTRISGSNPVVKLLATYLCELTLTEYAMSSCFPSHIAFSALILANQSQGVTPVVHRDIRDMYLMESERIESCHNSLYKVWLGAPRNKYQAVRLKYARIRHQKVACINPPKYIPFFYF
jgi:cyclin A